jgi:hypothetical protein
MAVLLRQSLRGRRCLDVGRGDVSLLPGVNEPDRIRRVEAPVLGRLTDAVALEAELAVGRVAGKDLGAELGRGAEVRVREIGRRDLPFELVFVLVGEGWAADQGAAGSRTLR